ncbi:MAG: hypothetical protein GX957_11560 [Clostridiaceae bacterium]|nr:hypothetical protein [Clostridiaceae bacterium]
MKEPFFGTPSQEPELPDNVYRKRLEKTLKAMGSYNLDYIVIYADREHYSNFDYLAGFGPRFEEGILVLSKSGKMHLLLGNECYHMHKLSRIPAEGVFCQMLSLPNQPIDKYRDLSELFVDIGIESSHKVGIVGWKLMYPIYGTRHMFDVPSFIVESISNITGKENIVNVTDLFIHPDYGIRIINSAHEIALFEFGASYASDAVQKMLLSLRTGMTELEVSQNGTAGSLPTTCFPKVVSGNRMDLGMTSNTTINEIKLGDRFQVTMGLRGGLTNRRGFAAYSEEDLPQKSRDFLEKIAAPYFAIVANWYEKIGIGISGGDIYDMVQTLYPKEKYGWTINPGHLIATEEWLSSPIYENSDIVLKSGMCIQMDIIPSTESHYAAPNCEDGVAIADEKLRLEISQKYPEVYKRMQKRREFMINILNIKLKPEILPLSNLAGLYRPFMLNKDKALVVGK